MRRSSCGHLLQAARVSRRDFLPVVALVALVGCASGPLEPEHLPGQELEPGSGLLVGSFARDPSEHEYYSQRFYYESKTTRERFEIHSQWGFDIFGGQAKDDFKVGDSHGIVFAHELPGGAYHYTNFSIYDAGGGFYQQYWRSKEPYSIPFEIVPGKVNYAGEIRLVPRVGKNIFGITIPAGGTWEIRDRRARDIELLRARFPDLNWDSVHIVVPDRKDIPTPLVLLPSELDAVE